MFVDTSNSITPLFRQVAVGLASTCILGTAVYLGYRVATPRTILPRQHRHPDLNDQVNFVNFIRFIVCVRID